MNDIIKLYSYIERASRYNLDKYITYYKKMRFLSIFFLSFGCVGFFASGILGALVELWILLLLILFFPLILLGSILLSFSLMCIAGAKEAKKIVKLINKNIIFLKDINYFGQDINTIASILRTLIKNNNLPNYQIYKNIFVYQGDLKIEESQITKEGKILSFNIINNQIIINKCPNCNNELFLNEKCSYCS